jgi:hypothetical protein
MCVCGRCDAGGTFFSKYTSPLWRIRVCWMLISCKKKKKDCQLCQTLKLISWLLWSRSRLPNPPKNVDWAVSAHSPLKKRNHLCLSFICMLFTGLLEGSQFVKPKGSLLLLWNSIDFFLVDEHFFFARFSQGASWVLSYIKTGLVSQSCLLITDTFWNPTNGWRICPIFRIGSW